LMEAANEANEVRYKELVIKHENDDQISPVDRLWALE